MAAAELNLDLITQFERLVAGTASQREHAWAELTGDDTFWRCCHQAARAGNSETLLEALSSASNLVDTVPIEGDPRWLWEARCLALIRLLKAALIASLAVRGCTTSALSEWLAWAAMDAPLPEQEAPSGGRSEAPQATIQQAWEQLASQGRDRELAAIRDAAVVLLGESAANTGRVATSALRAPLLLTIGDAGRLGWLWAERVSGGSGELLRASSTWLDPIAPSAQAAIDEAWEMVRAELPDHEVSDVRWWLSRIPQAGEEQRQHVRAYEIHGRSLQAAAAALFYCLSCDQPYDTSVAISAELAADGTLGGVGGLGGDAPKLRAARELAQECQGATVIVAEGNHPSPRTIAEWREEGVQLQVARDLEELKQLVLASGSAGREAGTADPNDFFRPPRRTDPVHQPWKRWLRVAGSAILLIGGGVGSVQVFQRLQETENSQAQVAQFSYAREIREAAAALSDGDLARAEKLLVATPPALREWVGQHLTLRVQGAEVVLPTGQPVQVAALRFGRDSRSFVSTGVQGYLRTWDGNRSSELWTEQIPLNAPLDFQAGALSRFGDRLAFVLFPLQELLPQAPWTLVVRDRYSKQSWRLAGSLVRVEALTLNELGTAAAVVTLSEQGQSGLEVFEQRQPRWEHRSYPLTFPCRTLTYAPDGRLLALAGDRGIVQLLRNGTFSTIWKAPQSVKALEFSPDGRSLAVGIQIGSRSMVQLLSLTGKPLRQVAAMEGAISSLSYDQAGTKLAVATETGNAVVWDCRTWKEAVSVRWSGSKKSPGLVVAMSPDGSAFALGDGAGRLEKWAVAGRVPERVQFQATASANTPSHDVLLSARDGQLSRDRFGQVQFRPAGRRETIALSTTGGGPTALSASGQLAAVEDQKYVKVRAAGDSDWKTLAATRDITALAFSPDSRNLAAAQLGGEVFVWDVRSWELLLRLRPNPPLPRQRFTRLEFVPNQGLVGQTENGTLVTWQVG